VPPLHRLARALANPFQKAIYERAPQACEGNDVVTVLPRQGFEHVKLPLTARSYEGVKVFATVGGTVEGIILGIEPYSRTGKRCARPCDHGIYQLGCGSPFINPAAHEVEDAAK
jgi:hypothetical protein